MSSQFLTIPWSMGCESCRYERYSDASSPTMMSLIAAVVALWPRSSARRMGRPMREGKVWAGKSARSEERSGRFVRPT